MTIKVGAIEKRDYIQATGHLLAYYHSDLVYIRNFQRYKKNPNANLGYAAVDGDFHKFLVEFKVARCLDKTNKNRFRELLRRTFDWVERNPDNVDGFVPELNSKLTHNHDLPSLISKVLFLNSPQTIPPFDRLVRDAATARADGQEISNYKNYLEFFKEFKSRIDISAELWPVNDWLSKIESDFCEIQDLGTVRQNRYADKLLWVLGGSQLKTETNAVEDLN